MHWLRTMNTGLICNNAQISQLRDALTSEAAYVVAEVDVTDVVESQRTVGRLQADMQSLLREILPQQVRFCDLMCMIQRCDG